MNKKILIASIIAVAILIGISFTSVVGFQSVKPDVKPSPLFTIRVKRAVDEESEGLTCDYVGKGKVANIYLPKINDETESVDNLINAIRRMDDTSLRRLAYLITYRLQLTDDTQEFDYEEIYQSLKELRDTPDSVLQHIQKIKGSIIIPNEPTLHCTITFENTIKCRLYIIIVIITIFIDIILLYSIFVIFPIYLILKILTLC